MTSRKSGPQAARMADDLVRRGDQPVTARVLRQPRQRDDLLRQRPRHAQFVPQNVRAEAGQDRNGDHQRLFDARRVRAFLRPLHGGLAASRSRRRHGR